MESPRFRAFSRATCGRNERGDTFSTRSAQKTGRYLGRPKSDLLRFLWSGTSDPQRLTLIGPEDGQLFLAPQVAGRQMAGLRAIQNAANDCRVEIAEPRDTLEMPQFRHQPAGQDLVFAHGNVERLAQIEPKDRLPETGRSFKGRRTGR